MSDTMLHGILNMPPDLWSDTPIDQAARHARYVEASRRIIELERERDEARAELEEYRSIAEKIGATKAVSERDKAVAELEMWRNGCIVREEDKVERDQWRECAEGLILYAREARNRTVTDERELARIDTDIARYKRLKEGGK